MSEPLHENRMAWMIDDIKRFVTRDPDWTYGVRYRRVRNPDRSWKTEGVTLTIKINGGAESES